MDNYFGLPKIIYQNEDFLVIDKPNNLSVQANKDYSNSLEKILGEQMPQLTNLPRSGIVNRLDRQTTGLLLVAKNPKTLNYLTLLFKERKIQKTYLALVQGNLLSESGEINFYLEKKFSSAKQVKMKVNQQKGKLVQMSFRVLERLGNFTFLAIFPLTGRTHQIRLGFQKINHPLYNDPLYNSSVDNLKIGQYLHAYALEFKGRKGENFSFQAPLPGFFQKKIEELGSKFLFATFFRKEQG